MLDGNDVWRRPYLSETSRSEPKSCSALPTDEDPLYDQYNLAPWCATTGLGTSSATSPTTVTYLRIGKPGTGGSLAKQASPAGPSTAAPAAGRLNNVDQTALQQCLRTQPDNCLNAVPALRECIAQRLNCNATPAATARTLASRAPMTVADAKRAALRLLTPKKGTSKKPLVVDQVLTEDDRALPYARPPLDQPEEPIGIVLIVGHGTVSSLSGGSDAEYEGFEMAFNTKTHRLLYACLGPQCPHVASSGAA
ncbi:hypothetical protein ABZS66_56210 [Dactylosporangium sp. NPDC005572]|uniref:hypothetical protein n=1 Tax=Dactylosporangium sp. NPDC005572 TaxID=3156889 RepID=UPI0033A72470